MEINNHKNWFREHHQRIVSPPVVLEVLSKDYKFPVQIYVHLEEKGHLIPMSYNKGEVTSVRVFFPQKFESLSRIERRYKLPEGFLLGKLDFLAKSGGSSRTEFLGLDEEVLEELVKNNYLSINEVYARLKSGGWRYLRTNNIIF